MNNKANTSIMGRRLMVIFIFLIIITGVWFMFLRQGEISKEEVSELIVGKWMRSDGPYVIEIVAVQDEGKLQALYLNPSPINIGNASWIIKEGVLQIYVELQDKNYPGSTYKLIFDEDKNIFTGTYYQAVSRQTFEVEFNRK